MFGNYDTLSETGWIICSFCILVLSFMSIASVTMIVRVESYILVYWPYFSLRFSYFGFGICYLNWKKISKIEKLVTMAFLCQLYRQYEMHGEDWYFRDGRFRKDYCRFFFGPGKSKWYCTYDESLIFSIHCIAEFVIGLTALYYSNLRPKFCIIFHGYSLALSIFIFYIGVSEFTYIAGTVASLICVFFNFYCTGQIKKITDMKLKEMIQLLLVGLFMRFSILLALLVHPGELRYNIREELLYVDGIYHKFIIIFQILLSCIPLTYAWFTEND